MARTNIGALLLLVASLVTGCSSAASPAPAVVPSPGCLATGAPATPGATGDCPNRPTEAASHPPFTAVSLGVDPTGKPVVLPKSVLDPILADAATRSGVAVDQLVVVTALSITWSDGSLGCPEPGQAYTQIVLEGYRVSIRANATTYDYRGAGMSGFKLCKSVAG